MTKKITMDLAEYEAYEKRLKALEKREKVFEANKDRVSLVFTHYGHGWHLRESTLDKGYLDANEAIAAVKAYIGDAEQYKEEALESAQVAAEMETRVLCLQDSLDKKLKALAVSYNEIKALRFIGIPLAAALGVVAGVLL